MDAATRSLAAELGPRKIRVNSVNPGMVETEGVHSAGIAESDFRKQVESQTPLGRIGQPRRHRPGGCLPRLGRIVVGHRRDVQHLGRESVIRLDGKGQLRRAKDTWPQGSSYRARPEESWLAR